MLALVRFHGSASIGQGTSNWRPAQLFQTVSERNVALVVVFGSKQTPSYGIAARIAPTDKVVSFVVERKVGLVQSPGPKVLLALAARPDWRYVLVRLSDVPLCALFVLADEFAMRARVLGLAVTAFVSSFAVLCLFFCEESLVAHAAKRSYGHVGLSLVDLVKSRGQQRRRLRVYIRKVVRPFPFSGPGFRSGHCLWREFLMSNS